MTNFLLEQVGTLIYMVVLMPMYVVLMFVFMFFSVLSLSIKLPLINKYVARFMKR